MPVEGQKIRHNGDVQEHLQGQKRRQASGQQHGEAVARMHGDPVAADDEQSEQDEDADGSYKAQLLARNGEDIALCSSGR